MEYSHEHLDKIIEQNRSSSNYVDYNVPAEFESTKSIVLDQVKIMMDLFPDLKAEPNAKKGKTDSDTDTVASSNHNTKVTDLVERANVIVTGPTPSSSTPSSSINTPKAPSLQPSSIANGPRIQDYIQVVLPKGKMAQKLANAHPYNYFLTAITSSPQTHTEPLSITLQEILDPSLGEIECTLQINFMIDVGWLLGHYHFAGCLDKPHLILYGEETDDLRTISSKKPQVTAQFIQMPRFATHHTKMMLLGYKDGSMRVVVSTANLYEDDWHNRTQGLWMSNTLTPMPDTYDTAAGDSETGFRNDLLKYLTSYNNPRLQQWIVRVRQSNFESVNVFLVTSIPGTHQESNNGHLHGHGRVAALLSKHCPEIEDTSPIVAQSSSLGSFGANPNVWLASEFVNSFRRDGQRMGIRKMPQLKLIYPTFNNVMGSHDGLIGGGCLPYGNQVHQKQGWLQQFLYQWKASRRHRSQAMPHIKTYCRWTGNKLHWFVLTSANVSSFLHFAMKWNWNWNTVESSALGIQGCMGLIQKIDQHQSPVANQQLRGRCFVSTEVCHQNGILFYGRQWYDNTSIPNGLRYSAHQICHRWYTVLEWHSVRMKNCRCLVDIHEWNEKRWLFLLDLSKSFLLVFSNRYYYALKGLSKANLYHYIVLPKVRIVCTFLRLFPLIPQWMTCERALCRG